jgi:hypothetical protein
MDRREIPVALVKTERNWNADMRIQNEHSVSPGLSQYAIHILTAAYLLKVVFDAQNTKVREQISQKPVHQYTLLLQKYLFLTYAASERKLVFFPSVIINQ